MISPLRRTTQRVLASALALGAFVVAGAHAPTEAHADPSAWVSVEGGPSIYKEPSTDVGLRGSMKFDAGVGSPATGDIIVGGLFGVRTIFDEGTDLLLTLRGCNHTFMTGDIGLAVDLGGYLRTFGDDSPNVGFAGALVLGMPFGLQFSVGTEVGPSTVEAEGLAIAGHAGLGIDLLRLTLFRESGTEWFPNPLSPARATAGR